MVIVKPLGSSWSVSHNEKILCVRPSREAAEMVALRLNVRLSIAPDTFLKEPALLDKKHGVSIATMG